MNERRPVSVAVRPMTRADVDAYAAWGYHDDPLFASYNAPRLDGPRGDDLWRLLAGHPRERRPFAGVVDGRFAAQLVLRYHGDRVSADIGIAIDPALVGRGLGTRILQTFARYCREEERLQRLTLDVASYNERAIRAYRATGFVCAGERLGAPDPGLDLAALVAHDGPRLADHVRREAQALRIRILHMEMRLDAET